MGKFVRLLIVCSAVCANPSMAGRPPAVLSGRSIALPVYEQAEEQKYRDKIQSEIEFLKKEIMRLENRIAALEG